MRSSLRIDEELALRFHLSVVDVAIVNDSFTLSTPNCKKVVFMQILHEMWTRWTIVWITKQPLYDPRAKAMPARCSRVCGQCGLCIYIKQSL